jgi:uncharacterized membrane protein YuzA (DUF378 family)
MLNQITKWLVVIGAVNWGLVGIGSLMGTNLNIVNLILGRVSILETLVYILVGLSAVYGLVNNK